MASSSISSTLDSSDETLNGSKLMRLILDGGTEALRNVLRKEIHPVSLQVILSNYKHILSNLKERKVLNQTQWDTLYPSPPRLPNINDFDITLLSVLLRNICSLAPPSTGWDSMPNNLDFSTEADVVRIKLFRNKRFAHIPKITIPADDFKKNWAEISLPLVRLGVDQGEIDRLENEKCGQDEIIRVLKEWTESTEKTSIALKNLETKLSETNNTLNVVKNDVEKLGQNESQSNSVLNKVLVHFDFKKEIRFYLSKYVSKTRLWVFDQVSDWFHDENSEHRAFVISSPAGMGKSVVAAVICDRFEKNVAYYHFIQYNNNQYNNPNFLLQSLAWHLCQVFPAYKKKLVERLYGNLGRPLNEMDIEGVFTTLLTELLTDIEDPDRRLLIVLDAVDESEYRGRHGLANLIANHFHDLPAYIRFVITARPEKKLLDKFSKLNPFFIEVDDEKNLNDIKLVIQNNLPSVSQPDVHTRLAEKCGGFMLYAYFLKQVYQDENFDENLSSLPEGIDVYYEKYLQRLERELGLLGVSNSQFLSFLSALAVAQEPITEAFVGSLFQFESNLGTKAKVRNTLNSLSSLFLIHEDRSISFFHKSVRDWLVNDDKPHYCIDIKRSHDVLFDLCVEELKNLKQRSVTSDLPIDVALRYSLKYCIEHLLQGNVDKQKMECFVIDYVTDLQVMFAGVYFDVDLTVNNLYMVTRHDCFQNISDGAKSTLNKLICLLRKSGSILHCYPQTFLQSVVNEGGKELSVKASNLLQTRYKNSVYLEYFKKDEKVPIHDVRCNLSENIRSMDISPNHDYAVCLYYSDTIELFSLTTGKSEWNISVPLPASNYLSSTEGYLLRCYVVFHPFKKLILFGKIGEVLDFKGTITTSPFQSDRNHSERTYFCFSSDGGKMATVHNTHLDRYMLIVWNVLTGVEEKCFPCSYPVVSFSFTGSGNYLGVSDTSKAIKIFDLTRNLEVKSGITENPDNKIYLTIISSYHQNSWLCCYYDFDRNCDDIISKDEVIVLNSDFSKRQVGYSSFMRNVHVRSTFRDLKSFIESHDEAWFNRATTQIYQTFGWFTSRYVEYLLIDDKTSAVFSAIHNTMYIVHLERLGNSKKTESENSGGFTAISNKGDVVYLSGNGKVVSICDVSSESRRQKSFEDVKIRSLVVVRNGVVLFKDDGTLELWNSDLTEHLSSFDVLTDVKRCLSVSDEIIACEVSRGCIVFFSVLTRKIIHRINHWLLADNVFVCSVGYHVLIEKALSEEQQDIEGTASFRLHLLKNEREVECAYEVFKETVFSGEKVYSTIVTKFSPDGDKLIICSHTGWQIKFDIFNINHATIQFHGRIPISDCGIYSSLSRFFGNEKLVWCRDSLTYLIDVENVKILTCLDTVNAPQSVSVCQERKIICLGYQKLEKFEIIQICCQR